MLLHFHQISIVIFFTVAAAGKGALAKAAAGIAAPPSAAPADPAAPPAAAPAEAAPSEAAPSEVAPAEVAPSAPITGSSSVDSITEEAQRLKDVRMMNICFEMVLFGVVKGDTVLLLHTCDT